MKFQVQWGFVCFRRGLSKLLDSRKNLLERATRYRCSVCLYAALLAASPVVLAKTQTDKPTVVPLAPATNQQPSDHKIPLLDRPLRLAEFSTGIDGMEPARDLAAKLTHISGFIQRSPVDGKVPGDATEVWVGRTHFALYFVFVCHDNRPDLIRTHLVRRENTGHDDHVSVLLDPFEDHRTGILFSVNPSGVQADAAWSESSRPDYSYDQVWDSQARVTPKGWVALMAIPYLSLRFPPRGGSWGVVFSRSMPRNSEVDFWPRIATSISGRLTQEGVLRGITSFHGSHNIQLNPYALAQNERTLNTLYPTDPYFSSRKLEGTAGGDAKVVIRDSIVLDATINPDFSQVESDQPQFTVNQRYPVYFPELRPFFLENASYFATPIDLVYTRNIVHPEFGARATGKVGSTNLGFLAIDDRKPGEIYPPGDPLHGQRALFAAGRVSHNLGEGSSVGAIYTDEEFGGSWNRIGGFDFTARLDEHWSAEGQAIVSSTRGLALQHSAPSYAAGPGFKLKLERSGHSFALQNAFRDYSRGLRTQVGFIPTTDVYSDSNNTRNQWYLTHSIVQSYGVETENRIAFDHAGDRVYHSSQVNGFAALSRGTVLAPFVGQNSDTLTPAQYPVLAANRNYTQNFSGFTFRSAPSSNFNFNITTLYGGNVNYNPATGAAPSLLHQNFLQALVTVQPLRSLTVDNTYLLDRNRSATDDALVLENQTLRTKINYQFTRALSARVIVQYDSTLVDPAETSLSRTKQVSSSALLTWLPHPGTAIYIGYNDQLANLDRTLCSRGPEGACDPAYAILPRSSEYLQNGRQFFVKASYLLRF